MELRTIECLNCGEAREVEEQGHLADAGECPSCGYLGWADSESLTSALRLAIDDRLASRAAVHAASSR